MGRQVEFDFKRTLGESANDEVQDHLTHLDGLILLVMKIEKLED
jgi:hypothetical protein